MARHDKTQELIAQLADMREEPVTEHGLARIQAALGHKSNVVVAAAVQLVAAHELTQLAPLLPPAFERFMTNPVKTDPQCRAKLAIATALRELDHDAEAIFRQGIVHVQREPVWGGTEDTAGELRGMCAIGLVDGHYPDALVAVAELLADPERNARLGAAQALARSGNTEVGVPLLRLKVRCGDEDAQVLSACLGALLSLAPESSLAFVASFLDDARLPVREAAALALGESRLPGALAPLCALADRSAQASERRIALVALAMLRSKPAWDYLIDLVAQAPASVACEVASILAAYRHDPQLGERVQTAAQTRGDRDVARTVAQLFADG